MKIYTEINYKWENDSLVEISSESFEYSGKVELCGGGGGGNPFTKAIKSTTKAVKSAGKVASDVGSTVVKKAGETVEAAQDLISDVLTSNPLDKINVPDASNATSMLTTGLEKLGENVSSNTLTENVASLNNPLKDMNIPDASHATSMLNTGLEKLGENVSGVVQGVADPIIRNVNEAGKLVQKAVTGSAGYSDEDPAGPADPAGPGGGGTGSEEAVGTMLTSSRKKERQMGRSYHSGGGSASQV